MVTFDLNKLREQIKQLKSLPNLKEVVALRKRLNKELDRIKKKEVVVAPVITAPAESANIRRSKSLKKHFRYLRLIRNNFPDLKFSDIRKQFSKRRQGFDSDIPDAVWQNPSP